MQSLALRARAASRRTAELSSRDKDAWLARAAERLESSRREILEANAADLAAARERGLDAPLVARLDLAGKWNEMLAGLRDVRALPDPVGETTRGWLLPNGLRVARVRIPLGVIAMIYESRPNVTVDAAALCVKAGNAVILRGGSEAIHSNLALATELRGAALDVGLPDDAVGIVPHTDRAAIDVLLQQDRSVDLVIPRGGPALIQKVTRESRIPVIKHDAGVCHVFVDASADPEMAAAIAVDSKVRQVSVCNGLETLLVHRGAVRSVLPTVLKALHEQGVELRGCPETCAAFPEAVPASEADWSAEYLDLILAVRVVPDLAAAVEHIQRYGTDHTEVIVTRDHQSAERFLREVNSAVVGVNCSTAFSDGYRLGLGAEIGISTSRLHAYGPMGLESLTAQKFVLHGEGQLRE
jgi:glutamate-5-semialdehyde dehydrogenase